MKCRECAEGKRISEDGIWCIQYGMIIREEHECRLKGGRPRGDDDDQHREGGDEAEI